MHDGGNANIELVRLRGFQGLDYDVHLEDTGHAEIDGVLGLMFGTT